MQTLITALIVLAASTYAAWALMPASWQRAIARRLGRPLPDVGGCGGCSDGCAAPKAQSERPSPPVGHRVITIHRAKP